MKILFSYDIDKDIENFILSARSLNNKEPTSFLKSYTKKYGKTLAPGKIRKFIHEYLDSNNIDIAAEMIRISTEWSKVENEFTKRAKAIFKTRNPARKIIIYLTTNNRCTYNRKDKYFFVYVKSKNTNLTIMHELFHFYTWEALSSNKTKLKISPHQYNEMKESLTELLNIEFHDMLDGSRDKGYPQHQKMRMFIKKNWQKIQNLPKLIETLLKTFYHITP